MSFSRFPFLPFFFFSHLHFMLHQLKRRKCSGFVFIIVFYPYYIISSAGMLITSFHTLKTEILNRKQSLQRCVGRRDCSHMELLTRVSTRDDSSTCFQVDDDPFSSVGELLLCIGDTYTMVVVSCRQQVSSHITSSSNISQTPYTTYCSYSNTWGLGYYIALRELL